MIVMSSLCRKVFNQVNLEISVENALWIEKRLQDYRINGLVKLIQGSSSKKLDYMDGYLQKYKWARRLEGGFHIKTWVFQDLQLLGSDFSWGEWADMNILEEKYRSYFVEAICSSVSRNVLSVKYVMAIYKSNVDEIIRKSNEASALMFDTTEIIENKQVTETTTNKWGQLKNELQSI